MNHTRARTTAKTTTVAGLAAVFAVMGASPVIHAQERTAFEFTLPASAGSYPVQYSIDVGDTPRHAARIYEIERLFPPGAASINGVRVIREKTVGFSDYTNGNGANSSYGIWFLADNSRIFLTTAGTATTSISDIPQPLAAHAQAAVSSPRQPATVAARWRRDRKTLPP